jgi:ribosomal-protein-alanine N-acetyltransferase
VTNNPNSLLTFPPLETDRLHLRLLADEDIDFIFHHFSDPDVCRYLMDEPPVADLAEAEAIIHSFADPEVNNRIRWAMVRKSDGQVIGTCGFHRWEKDYFHAELGYDLSADCWGQGYTTEALRPVIENGFERMGLNRIEAFIYIENQGSIRVAEKLGFKQEGCLRDYFYLDGKFYDHYLYSLLKRDWLQK